MMAAAGGSPSPVAVGLDIGGTKTQCAARFVGRAGEPLPGWTAPSTAWAAALWDDPAGWIAGRVGEYLVRLGLGWESVAVAGVGAHGLEDPDTRSQVHAQLSRDFPTVTWTVVNDAELVVPAAGLAHGIGVICGTGSIVVATDAAGVPLRVGGWGWVLGDEGSGSALVREALRAVLRRHDAGLPPGELTRLLLQEAAASDPIEMGIDLSFGRGPAAWGAMAPVVFTAADAGDPDALEVITAAGRALAAQVAQAVARGAVGSDVVVAGSVIVKQERLRLAFTQALSALCPALAVRVLQADPVEGALALAVGRDTPQT